MRTVPVPPAAGEEPAEPVSLDEAKAQLRVTHSEHDDLIAGLITAGREKAEAETWRSVVLKEWETTLDSFPCDGAVTLPFPPIREIISVETRGAAGTFVALAPESYSSEELASTGTLRPAYGGSWPALRSGAGDVRIRYRAGYDEDLPAPALIRRAVLFAVSYWYNNPEGSAEAVEQFDGAFRRLLWPERTGLS